MENASKTPTIPCELNEINDDLFRENLGLKSELINGLFGLEKEHVRCTSDGELALTPHPGVLGNKADHPYITTDFSESQIEMITPPLGTVSEAHGFMKTLHQIVNQALPNDELLWMQSMPPILPEEDAIPLAQFEGPLKYKTEYRENLSKIYGKGRQMISGAHFNFSFSEPLFIALSQKLNIDTDLLRSRCYMKVLRNLMRHRWWLVAALGRSPVAHSSLKLKALDSDRLFPVCCDFGISIRSSSIGYRNPHPLQTRYCNLEDYNGALDHHIKEGKLLSRNELYLPVRLKFDEEHSTISHLEVRLLDIDPNDEIGMSVDSLRVLHLFCLFALLEPETDRFEDQEQQYADELQNHIATTGLEVRSSPCGHNLPPFDFKTNAAHILEKLKSLLESLKDTSIDFEGYQRALAGVEMSIKQGGLHPSSKIIQDSNDSGFIDYHLAASRNSKAQLEEIDFRFFGFEDLELSTQLLLRESIKRGVNFDILDRKENFIHLHKHGKEEYVVQATRTSLDNYSSILVMENKVVTKKVLSNKGIRVPEGGHYTDMGSARSHWFRFKGKPIVIKPKSTNFGLGISILKENESESNFEEALNLAFAEDSEVLIEHFVTGKEYRFFLIDSQVVGILHRVPANVTGDGVRSIRELVALKNHDPRRGKGYRTPLEKIDLGSAEALFLKEQGMDFSTIPENEKTVFLRENSNISTGGDSIDYTEQIHRSYHEIASQAANAVDVRITGLDMMIDDICQPANANNYAIIEMNFNPAIHIHCFPYEGKNRHLDQALLNRLGFM